MTAADAEPATAKAAIEAAGSRRSRWEIGAW
jgi:hypothetical protein